MQIDSDGHSTAPIDEKTGQSNVFELPLTISDQFISERRRQPEEDLVRMLAELSQANTELQEFSSRASHDLLGPLRNMTVCSELLLRKHGSALNQNAQELLQLIADESRVGLALVKSLLTYTRLLQAKFEFGPAHLDNVLRQALSGLGAEIEKSGSVITSDPLPQVTGDFTQLAQVFQNLIANAIRYRREVAPAIHVAASRRETEWVVSVADNGTGIADHLRSRIFKPFERLHKSPVSGSGLGLAICKRIVEKHNGQIWFESTPDVGSVFSFSLPVSAVGSTLEQ
jgi:two-component system, chemotaxis family, sensor kinase Cph1